MTTASPIPRNALTPRDRAVALLAVLGGFLTSGVGIGLALSERELLPPFETEAIWGLEVRRFCLVAIFQCGLVVGVLAARHARRGRRSAAAEILWSYSLIGLVIALPSVDLANFFFWLSLPFAVGAVLALRGGRGGGTRRLLLGLSFWLVVATFASFDSWARHGVLWAVSRGHARLLDRMAGAGAPVEGADEEGRTPLMFAVEAGDAESVDVLMAHGARPYRRDSSGRSAMMRAVDQESPAMAERLLAALRERLEASTDGGPVAGGSS